MKRETMLLSRSDIQSLIELGEICDIVEATFRDHGLGQVVLPAKISLNIESVDNQAWMNAMPAYVKTRDAAGIKWAGGFINNPRDHDLPYVMATIILNDPQTGQALAVMDGAHITNCRTGAAAAVCAKHVARSDSRVVAMIGAGVQARWTLRALGRYFDIQQVRVVDKNPEAAEQYIRDMTSELGIRLSSCDSADRAAEGADLVFTATTANAALINDRSIEPGTTVVALGSYQELDDQFSLTADKVIVDSIEQCTHRGELAHLFEQGLCTEQIFHGEIGEIVAGSKPGRKSSEERILVVPIGLGSLDVALAKTVWAGALEKGIGGKFSFSD